MYKRQIYHSGSGSAILNNNNHQLTISSDNALNLTSRTGQEYFFRAYPNNRVELYYDYSSHNTPKLQTSATGVTVDGIVAATSFSGSGDGLTYTSQLSHRNKIINGAMQVAQRGTSFLSSASASQYTLDRFRVDVFPFGGTSGAATITQSDNAPAGFSKSLKVDITATDTSLVGNNYSQVSYQLERRDVRSFAYGGSNAKPITLSFYVRSNKTGNYNVNILQYGNSTRLASFTYAISSPNTWERKTITIPADTSGNIVDGTASGFNINFGLAYGGNYTTGTNQTSFGSYVAANSGVGQAVNLYDSTSNEWYLSGVQLEIGSVATPFEHRSFGEELSRCQRYFYRVSTTASGTGQYKHIGTMQYYGGANPYGKMLDLPVPMRTIPTGSFIGDIRPWTAGGSPNGSFTTINFDRNDNLFLGSNGSTTNQNSGGAGNATPITIWTSSSMSADAEL